MGHGKPTQLANFSDWKRRVLTGRAPFLGKGEELGLSRNTADSPSGVSRYDQTPRGSGDVEDLFYELVKGCHMRPRGCSYVVCIRFTLQGFKSIRITVCLSDMSTAVSWAIFASNSMKQRIGSEVGSWYLWLCWQEKGLQWMVLLVFYIIIG